MPTRKLNKLQKRYDLAKFKWRKFFILRKLDKQKESVNLTNSLIAKLITENENSNNQIVEIEKSKNAKIYQLKKPIYEIQKNYNEKRSLVVKLQENIETNTKNENFIPLKNLFAYEYRKIIGVYIVRNNENQKYYVGQSKDVIKRLNQHFKGTVPANIIFAEDYYLSNNKTDLFSVRIIPLQTKDELDSTEKLLIEKYDSFYNGYNKTNGNN